MQALVFPFETKLLIMPVKYVMATWKGPSYNFLTHCKAAWKKKKKTGADLTTLFPKRRSQKECLQKGFQQMSSKKSLVITSNTP